MEQTYYALLIGINKYSDPDLNDLRYAEKDALDLYNALTNKEFGMFPQENVKLLIGKDANWDVVQHQLQKKVLERASNETILVYYAGHTCVIDEKVYLLCADLSLPKIEQNKLPYNVLSLTGFRDLLMPNCKAKDIIIILDTCQSGTIISKERGTGLNKRIFDVFQQENIPSPQDNQTRSILVSSPPTEPSMEDVQLQNGVFTHCILEGLTGAISSSEVTVDLLSDYVKNHEMLRLQKPGAYIYGYGRVILSKPKIIANSSQNKIISVDDNFLQKISKYPELNAFIGPLDDYVDVIERIFDEIEKPALAGLNIEHKILESVRSITNASNAMLLIKTEKSWDILYRDSDSPIDSQHAFEILAALNAQNADRNAFSETIVGFIENPATEQDNAALVFPIKNKERPILILIGKELRKYATNIFGHIIHGLFYGLEKAPQKTIPLIKAYLLDYLKLHYKYLPTTLYNIRHDLFKERLFKMSVKFQPIICFSMNEPYISGFEALASDHADEYATPHDLLKAAELWGDHFKIHLDQYFFEKSVTTYVEQLQKTPGKRRPEDILDLSINVYPETLIRTKYYAKVKSVMDRKLLPKRKLHLEISEKSPFPENLIPGDGIITKEMKSFRDLLYKYVAEIGIGFAIDDFGIGHSSVSRLATLTPNYLKIDREILTADTVSETISFIVNYAHTIVSQRILESAKIVVEGFDQEVHDKHISLSQLLSLGVEYIQGYIIGFPTDELIRLDQEKRDKLVKLMLKRDVSKSIN